jgi:hypothetical protein
LPRGLGDRLTFHPEGGLLLFRFERSPQARTGTCLIRELRPGAPARTLARIPDPYRVVYTAATAPDGAWLVVEGVRAGPHGPQRLIRCLDWRTGADRWSMPKVNFGPSASATLTLDPTGRLVVVHPDGASPSCPLVETASGKRLGAFPFSLSALGPGGRRLVGPGPAGNGHQLYRDKLLPLLPLNLDTPSSTLQFVFSADGRLLAWGNTDGTVSLCDLAGIKARLSKAGLGW